MNTPVTVRRTAIALLTLAALVGTTAQVATMQPAPVSLTVTMLDDIDPILAGMAMTWRVQIVNEDPSGRTALDVVVHESVPDGVTLVAILPTRGECGVRQRLVECRLGNLAPGQSATIKIVGALDVDFLDEAQTAGELSNTVAVTHFTSPESPASATLASARTRVLHEYPRPPDVIPRTIAVSPSCVEPGGKLTLFGEGFNLLALEEGDIELGGFPTPILAYSDTGLVIEIPQLVDGVVEVQVAGAANVPTVRVSGQCNPTPITEQDAEEGFIAGDILIFFNKDPHPVVLESFRREYGFKTVVQHPLLGYYFIQLGEEINLDAVEAKNAPVTCLANKRSSAAPLDLVLLVDRSGTMDRGLFNLVLDEMGNQMYCLINRFSRISVMVYHDDVELVLPLTDWRAQHAALQAWVDTPIRTKGSSNLGDGLNAALDYLETERRPGVSQQIMVFTRGPSSPRILDPQPLIDRANNLDVTIHGLGLTGFIFPERNYRQLRAIAQGTGRDVLVLDERDAHKAAGVVTCTIVYGILGSDCDDRDFTSPVDTPAADLITCVIVNGIYGVGECGGAEALDLIPDVSVDATVVMVERLNNDPRVEDAFFNDLLDDLQDEPDSMPDDPDLFEQAWFLALGLPQGWTPYFPKLGQGTILAVIDTGMDLEVTQIDLSEVFLNEVAPDGLNFAPTPPEDQDVKDGNDNLGHGTAVTSIAASRVDNGFNGAGVSPKATVIALKVFSVVEGEVKTSNDSVAQALMNAFVLGVDVVNMSLGCQKCSAKQEDRLRKFYDKIIENLKQQAEDSGKKFPIIVAASGNDGTNVIDPPAHHPGVIAVGSIQPNLEQRSTFSNYGPELDFVVIGENTMTTTIGGGFENAGSGTSFAAPQVAGLVALILAESPGLSVEEIMAHIRRCFTADVGEPGFDEETGWGRIFIPSADDAAEGCL